jgi:hypothetical protein
MANSQELQSMVCRNRSIHEKAYAEKLAIGGQNSDLQVVDCDGVSGEVQLGVAIRWGSRFRAGLNWAGGGRAWRVRGRKPM